MLFLYKAQQIAIQCHIAEVIETTTVGVEELVLSESEYRAAQVDKSELLIQGKLYDIKSRRFEGNKIIVKVIEDREEEGVLRNIRKAVNGSSGKNVPGGLLDLLTITYILPTEHIFRFCTFVRQAQYSITEDSLLNHTVGIVVPPPDMI